MAASERFELAGQAVALGEHRQIDVALSQSYSSVAVSIPVHVWRGGRPGPAVFVTGAVHGDELNGTGIVRALILDKPFTLELGTLVLVPVVNLLGFERHARYLPDRRDLNRSFPGSPNGSLASRFAHGVFEEIVKRCDYGIDLHSAAVRRANYPNVRGDLRDPACKRLATAFGAELVVNNRGPKGSLRRAACAAGCPTIMLEAGEVWKVEPAIVEYGVRGVTNVLVELGMVRGSVDRPPRQLVIQRTTWVRAQLGGFLEYHVTLGSVVSAGQAIATNRSLLGEERNTLESPVDGVVMSITTIPAVAPGDPVCQIAVRKVGLAKYRDAVDRSAEGALEQRVREDLARKVAVSPRDDA